MKIVVLNVITSHILKHYNRDKILGNNTFIEPVSLRIL